MSLQEKLDAHKAKSAGNRKPEVAAALKRGVEELRASGIMNNVLKAGARAPEFTLPNAQGVLVDSKQLLGRGPLVVSFYRGHW